MKHLIYIDQPALDTFTLDNRPIKFSPLDHPFINKHGIGTYLIYHNNNLTDGVVYIDKDDLMCKTPKKSTFVKINDRSSIKRSKIILVDRNNRSIGYCDPYEIVINSEYHFYFKIEEERNKVYEDMIQ